MDPRHVGWSPNPPLELNALREAAEWPIHWTEMHRTILVSMVLGIAWHCIVLALMGELKWFDVCLGLPVALLTGALAGLFTVWSRRRWPGRERVLAVVATYYLALLVYTIGMTLTESIRYACEGYTGPAYDLTWSRVGGELAVFAVGGTMFAVLLLPLCYVTRLLVWRVHCRIRPNSLQEHASRDGSIRES